MNTEESQTAGKLLLHEALYCTVWPIVYGTESSCCRTNEAIKIQCSLAFRGNEFILNSCEGWMRGRWQQWVLA